MNLLRQLEESPPFYIYYFAKENGRHPGLDVIAEKSGLSRATILRLAKSITWRDVKIGTLDRLCKAVGQDFVANQPSRGACSGARYYLTKPFRNYLKFLASRTPRQPLRHLSTGQKKRFLQLCEKWSQSRKGIA